MLMRRFWAGVFVLAGGVLPAGASGNARAAGTVEIIAGTGVAGHAGDGGPAVQAQLNNPFGVVRGPDGAIYVCEYGGQVVRRIAADGTIATIAGTGAPGRTGDGGPATNATLNLPHEIRFDRRGDLFIADMKNHAVRRIDMKTGVISTFAGTGLPGYAGDGGPATKAQFRLPHSLQFDASGNLFICDVGNHVVRRIDATTGNITTFAGTGKPGPTPDGSPVQGTPLNGPRSLDFDAAGHLWLATREGNQVFTFDLAAGKILHVAGTGGKGPPADGPARLATLNGPKGIAVAPDGTAYLADTENQAVRRIDPKSGRLERVAGTGAKPAPGRDGFSTDPLQLRLNRPHGVFVDADGSLLIGDSENHRVLRVK